MQDWPHQIYGFEAFVEAYRQGKRRICLTSPTGMGKTNIAKKVIKWCIEQGAKCVLYTNRRMLLDQTSRKIGIDHGIRCAGHDPEFEKNFQISSIQTEHSRTVHRGLWDLHSADVAIIDEAHLMKGKSARSIINRHVTAGGCVLGMTATPLDLDDIYTDLIVAGRNSDGRECGALVPAIHYGVDEPDLSDVEGVRLGEDLSEDQNRAAMGAVIDGKPTIRLQKLVGRVFDWFRTLNPTEEPTILFAPGVKESIWFAEQFTKAGVPAAHIDGREVWFDGEFTESNKKSRDFVLNGSQDGSIKVICNRFVMREGIDAPWLAHGIFATVFGSVQSYLQSGGRLLRSYPGLRSVTVQDHGGNWHRHGSLNQDRNWELGLTSRMVGGVMVDSYGDPQAPRPFVCPKCLTVLVWTQQCNKINAKCPRCGGEMDFTKRSRPVLQTDGSLVMHPGDAYKPKPVRRAANTESLWEKVYWRFRNSKSRTFGQAVAFFEHEYGYRPPRTMKLMPVNLIDWYRKVKDVPVHKLRKEST